MSAHHMQGRQVASRTLSRRAFVGLALGTMAAVPVYAFLNSQLGSSVSTVSPPGSSAVAVQEQRLLQISHAGEGWSVSLAENYRNTAFVASFNTDTTKESVIELVEARTGEILAAIHAQLYPYVLARPSANEILVSDYTLGEKQFPTRLLVFDAANGLSLKRIVPLPKRINYTMYAPGLALSNDESRLFYLGHEMECVGNDAICGVYSLNVVELNSAYEIKMALLPKDCGFGHINPVGSREALVSCSNITVAQTIDASGSTHQVETFYEATGLTGHRNTPRSLFAAQTPSGIGLLMENGVMFVNGGGQPTRQIALWPGPDMANWRPESGHARVAYDMIYQSGDELVVGYRTYPGVTLDGVVTVDLRTLVVKKRQALPNTRFLLPEPDSENFLTLDETGTLRSINIDNATSAVLPFRVSEGADRVLAR